MAGTLSGTPEQPGDYALTVTAGDAATPQLSKTYQLRIADPAAEPVPHSVIEVSVAPGGGGRVEGGGSVETGTSRTVIAMADPGHTFVKWSEQGELVSEAASYDVLADQNHSLVAHFTALPPSIEFTTAPGGGLELVWPVQIPDWSLEESPSLEAASWTPFTGPSPVIEGRHHAPIDPTAARRFFRLHQP